MFTADQITLLLRLQQYWPSPLKLTIDKQQDLNFAEHPLACELMALGQNERASLPFFTPKHPDRIIWITIAPNADNLLAAITDLRAWMLPNFGWEHDTPIVIPSETSSPLNEALCALSPAGYFRWWTMRTEFNRTVEKLRALRHLEQNRPVHTYLRPPTLFDLLQQYDVALLTGDIEVAQEMIDGINLHQLDTAANACFMQLRLWDHFRMYDHIVTHPQLAELVQLRMPQSIRLAVVRSFHSHFLAPLEERGDVKAAVQVYKEQVHDWLAGLLEFCQPADGIEARRCIGYKAGLLQDGTRSRHLLEGFSDPVLSQLLTPLALPETRPLLLRDSFYDALRRGDWRTVQDIGQQILLGKDKEETQITSEYLQDVLRISLEFHADPSLRELLVKFLKAPLPITTSNIPQTWLEFVALIREKEWSCAGRFLSLDNRPSLGDLSLPEITLVIEILEELLTDPTVYHEQAGHQLTHSCLPTIIRDFLVDPEFPRPSLGNIYRHLFQVWGEQKRGSTSPPDANLLLTLAEAILRYDNVAEREVSEIIRAWWAARKVPAMLPFLLDGLDILSELTTTVAVNQSLWIDGAALIRLDPTMLSIGERHLWRIVGRRIGLDENTIEEFLNLNAASEIEIADPLTEAGLKKVAIVSLREEAAQAAATLIGQRTNANVFVVSETHVGKQTANAKTADVILFVWASSTHAIYRAFDDVRNRIAYVQGKGAASIVLTLERWVVKES